jgi:hypothetical protein
MSEYMSSLVYVLEKTEGIQDVAEFADHGSAWTTDMDIEITQYQQTVM